MSKAFTREDSEAAEELPFVPDLDLRPGEKNYVTPEGAARLREDVARLRAAPRDDPRARAATEQRLAALCRRLELMEVVDPASQPADRVLFGATVTLRDEEGGERSYRVVGIDEADAAARRVSWRSPIAQALIGRRVGDVVTLPGPGGERDVELVAINYV